MQNNRLPITTASPEASAAKKTAAKKNDRAEVQARFERLWLTTPEIFDPTRNCIERQRMDNTLKLINRHVDLQNKLIADLGCGAGILSKQLRNAGAVIHAVDIASNALKKLHADDDSRIETFQDYLPTTSLKDDAYDGVLCTEVIGYLDPKQHRLLLSELARLVKPEGWVVCSTALDASTEAPAQLFVELVKTELEVDEWVFSYHRLHQRLQTFFETPQRYAKAYQEPEYRAKRLQNYTGFGRKWFMLNTSAPAGPFWRVVQYAAFPMVQLLTNSTVLSGLLEKITRFWWDNEGITQAICIGKRKPILATEAESLRQYKRKAPVWE